MKHPDLLNKLEQWGYGNGWRERPVVKQTKPKRITTGGSVKVNKLKAIAHLGSKCLDCGKLYPPAAMQFHHRDPATKSFHLSGAGLLKSWEEIVVELAKCDLLCANCHMVRHAVGWKKTMAAYE